jgi:hypothetical protein
MDLCLGNKGDNIELTDKSNLKKILISLRKKGLINERIFIQTIDRMKSSSTQDEFVPLFDMITLIDLDFKLQETNSSLNTIDLKMKKTVKEWEEGKLSKDTTKETLTKLVSQQKKLVREHQLLQSQISRKTSRLKDLDKSQYFDLEDFTSSLIESSDNKDMAKIGINFGKFWSKYMEETQSRDVTLQQHLKLDDIEADIVNSLMTPIIEENPVIFDLEDVVKPPDYESPLLIVQDRDNKTNADVSQTLPMEPTLEKYSKSIWHLVGKIAYNSSKNPLGLFRPPIIVNGKTYLPIVWEKSLPISILKKQYKPIFEYTELDLKQHTTQQIKSSIAEVLKVPVEMALHPTILNMWISKIGVESIPAKPQLSKVKFVEEAAIVDSSLDPVIISDENLEQIRVSAWIPAPGERIAHSFQIGQKVYGMAKSKFGKIAGVMENTPFGHSLIIKREVPPSYILDIFLDGLGKQNLAELRFNIAKTLKIGEGEAFQPQKLWYINNQERLLLSPHEILTSYFTILPSAAFNISKEINAKPGVYFHSVPETFRYLVGNKMIKTDKEQGIIYGFSIDNGQFSILWSSKTSDQVIKELGRKSSVQYVNRFKRRVSMALGIPIEESMWPSNLARYFVNFIWIEEDQSLSDALMKIEKQFSLQKVLFSDISEITKDGLSCRRNHG